MAWVRLSDDFYDHPKFDKAGVLGIALFAAGLAWCNRNLTDGFIPRKTASRLLDFEDAVQAVRDADRNAVTNVTDNDAQALFLARDTVAKLLEAGLWREVEGGYEVHDYLEYQASREQIEAGRESNAARQKAWRERRKAERDARKKGESEGERNGKRNAVSNASRNGTVTGAPNPKKEVLRTSLNPSEDAPEDTPPTTNDRPDVDRVCDHLRNRVIEGGKPAHRVTITKGWRDAARLLMDRDGVTEEEIHRAIDWVQDHAFWKSNVAAMPKLREKFFELRARAENERDRSRPNAGPSQAAQRTADRCSEHTLVLPCDSCLGEIKSGDTETPLRLLTQEGPDVRWDLAQHLKETA